MNAYIARLPLPASLGDYRVHQRIYEVAPDRPVFRRFDDHVLVVSASRPVADQVKPYAPVIQAGETFAFSIYASVEKRNGRLGYDPVMKARTEQPDRAYTDIANEVAQAWLTSQGARHGFECLELIEADYTPLSLVRPTDRQTIRHAAIHMRGRLRVDDPAPFANALVSGVGRGRAWGLGLVLIRR